MFARVREKFSLEYAASSNELIALQSLIASAAELPELSIIEEGQAASYPGNLSGIAFLVGSELSAEELELKEFFAVLSA